MKITAKIALAGLLKAALLYHSAAIAVETGFTPQLSSSEPLNRFIVKFSESSTTGFSASSAIQQLGVGSGGDFSLLRKMGGGAHVFEYKGGLGMQEICDQLGLNIDIEYAVPDRLLSAQFLPNDTDYSSQWHLSEAIGGINLESAWDYVSGDGAVVAVVDTGITAHFDLDGQTLPGYDFVVNILRGTVGSTQVFHAGDGDGRDGDPTDPGTGLDLINLPSNWHGSHVAGTVAAKTNNSAGVAGVAFSAKILPVRVLGLFGVGLLSDILDGVRWAAGLPVSGIPNNPNPADVINLSLGGGEVCSPVEQALFDEIRASTNAIVVAAGGNANAAILAPANCNHVLSVVATDRNGDRAPYSNFGLEADIAAPGGDLSTTADGVFSTINSGQFDAVPNGGIIVPYQGTSMAAPHVAGVAALMYSANPGITADEASVGLISTARAFPGTCSQCGAGIVDADAAVFSAVDIIPLTLGDYILAQRFVLGIDDQLLPIDQARYDINEDGQLRYEDTLLLQKQLLGL